METIGERISKARRYLNLNQKELCQRANITEASLSRYENNIREPKALVLTKLADALDVSTDYLLGLTDDITYKKETLKDKSKKDINDLLDYTEKELRDGGFMLSGKPASKEAINSIITSMRLGIMMAIEDEKKKEK